jgi:hypothetical protein
MRSEIFLKAFTALSVTISGGFGIAVSPATAMEVDIAQAQRGTAAPSVSADRSY